MEEDSVQKMISLLKNAEVPTVSVTPREDSMLDAIIEFCEENCA